MKTMKKLFALLLVAAMCMALCVTAFASDYVITVTNTNTNITIAGKTYTAYKLFDAKYSGTGSDAAVSYTIDKNSYFYTDTDTKAILDDYFTFTATAGDTQNMNVTPKATFDDAAARALADALQPYLTGATAAGSGTVATGAETTDIDVGGPGYYLVDGKALPKEDSTPSSGEIVAAVALTTAKPTATVNPKADAPSVDKKITKIDNATTNVSSDQKEGTVSVGSKVEYELTSKVPDMTGYKSYQFIFTDTLSEGLTYNGDVAVTIDNTTYTGFTAAATTSNDGSTVLTITFTNFIAQAANAGKDISIKYSATVNQEAVKDGSEENSVNLQFSHNPYDENAGTPDEVLGKTPDSTTTVYDTSIQLTKVDNANKSLTGAKFKIEGNASKVSIVNEKMYQEDNTNGTFYRLKDGTYTETASTSATADQYESTTTKYKEVTVVTKDNAAEAYVAEGWVKSDGTLSFNGLGAGTYTITELVAPDGYNLLASPITVTVSFDYSTNVFTAKVGNDNASVDNNLITFDVVNEKGAEMPSTGGIGTKIFYTMGAVLVVGAGVVLVSRKRAGE